MVDPQLNANPRVDEAHHRVSPAGFKYLVTEMVCWAAGGPQSYSGRPMGDVHRHLMISTEEWHVFMQDLQQTLALARQWSEERIAASRGLSSSYLGGEGPFPERLPWLVLCSQFLTELIFAVQRWAEDDLRSLNGQIEFILRQALAKRGVKLTDEPAPPANSGTDAPPAD